MNHHGVACTASHLSRGCWCRDGLGGVVKRRLREDITNGKRDGKTVDIKTARGCYDRTTVVIVDRRLVLCRTCKWTDEELWWVPKPLVVLTTAPQWARGSPLPTTSLLFRAACDMCTCRSLVPLGSSR